MGKGIALQFKKLFPANYKAYKKACDEGKLTIGHVFVYDLGALHTPQFVINFPTKKHWKGKSPGVLFALHSRVGQPFG